MRLAADSVDGPAGSSPLGDVLDHGLQLGGVGVVEVEVVDVELGLGVLEGFLSAREKKKRMVDRATRGAGREEESTNSLVGSLESNADIVLAEEVVVDGLSERAVLLEDLVDDIL